MQYSYTGSKYIILASTTTDTKQEAVAHHLGHTAEVAAANLYIAAEVCQPGLLSVVPCPLELILAGVDAHHLGS